MNNKLYIYVITPKATIRVNHQLWTLNELGITSPLFYIAHNQLEAIDYCLSYIREYHPFPPYVTISMGRKNVLRLIER